MQTSRPLPRPGEKLSLGISFVEFSVRTELTNTTLLEVNAWPIFQTTSITTIWKRHFTVVWAVKPVSPRSPSPRSSSTAWSPPSETGSSTSASSSSGASHSGFSPSQVRQIINALTIKSSMFAYWDNFQCLSWQNGKILKIDGAKDKARPFKVND